MSKKKNLENNHYWIQTEDNYNWHCRHCGVSINQSHLPCTYKKPEKIKARTIYLTDSEWQTLNQKAAEIKLSPSLYIRRIVLKPDE